MILFLTAREASPRGLDWNGIYGYELDEVNMSKKLVHRRLDALLAIMTNYAAIAFGIGVFEHSRTGFISGIVTVACCLYVTSLYGD